MNHVIAIALIIVVLLLSQLAGSFFTEPKKCPKCGSSDLSRVVESDKDYLKCNHCGKEING